MEPIALRAGGGGAGLWHEVQTGDPHGETGGWAQAGRPGYPSHVLEAATGHAEQGSREDVDEEEDLLGRQGEGGEQAGGRGRRAIDAQSC